MYTVYIYQYVCLYIYADDVVGVWKGLYNFTTVAFFHLFPPSFKTLGNLAKKSNNLNYTHILPCFLSLFPLSFIYLYLYVYSSAVKSSPSGKSGCLSDTFALNCLEQKNSISEVLVHRMYFDHICISLP